ncbi:MAG: DUF4296 domain-containing protein [Cyclobacteriaceae bacterium]
MGLHTTKRNLLFLCLFFISFFSCKEEGIPKKIIPFRSMVSVLIDSYQTEAVISKMKFPFDSSKYIFDKIYFPKVLEKHNLTHAQYDSSYAWYLKHKEWNTKLLGSVKDSLEKKSSRKELYFPKIGN